MRILFRAIFCVAIVGLTNPTAFAQGKRVQSESPPIIVNLPTQCGRNLDGQRVVFVVNGVNNGTAATDSLIWLNGDHGLGLKLRTINWCRHDSIRLDLVDHEAQLNAAHRLASEVAMIRRDSPNAKIFFVAHSAGTRVALAAAELLPPQSVDRIILIASAVSCSYDLTTALRTSRQGIDHFYSADDRLLDWAVEKVGTSDGLKSHVAGRVGFRLPYVTKGNGATYSNLRQYAWSLDRDGLGGHFAWTREGNMKRCIVPLLFADLNPPAAIKGPAMR